MKIGLDFTPAIYDRGVSRYTTNLARALMEKAEAELTLYGTSFRDHTQLVAKAMRVTESVTPAHAPRFHFRHLPPSLMEYMWRFGFLPIQRQLPDIQVFHSWDWLQPPDTKLPLVSTIHDLAMLKYPDTAHPKILSAHQRSWDVLRQREADIIAVSQATKKDIVELLDIPAFRVHVIPEALPREIRRKNELLSAQQAEMLVQKLQLTRPYILFVGTREPRKNLQRLIEAWLPLQNEVELLIAGEKGWDETADSRYNHVEHLRFLGKVSDTELNVLYAEAEAFAFPSLDEGFGLPILEAFYHGTPVVTSQANALVEVAGNAAELVDPASIEDIRRGLQLVLGENEQEQRKRLQRMVIRLHMFSWHQVATQTLAVYTQAITRHA